MSSPSSTSFLIFYVCFQNLRDHGFEKFEAISTSSVSLSSLLANLEIQQDVNLSDFVGERTSSESMNVLDVKVFSPKMARNKNTVATDLARERIRNITVRGSSPLNLGALQINTYERKEFEGGGGGKHGKKSRQYRRRQQQQLSAQAPIPVLNTPASLYLSPTSKKQKRSTRDFFAATMDHELLPSGLCSLRSSSEALPELVYSMGALEVPWKVLEDRVTLAILSGLEEVLKSSSLSERLTVNILHGLSAMGCHWSDLPPSLHASIFRQLQHVSQQLGEQGVAVSILSLAKFGVSWHRDVPAETRAMLSRRICEQNYIGEHALSSLLTGFGKLNMTFSDLDPGVQAALKEAIVVCHLGDKCTPQGVANSLYGLAKLSTKWSDLSSSVRMSLSNEIIAVAPISDQVVSWTHEVVSRVSSLISHRFLLSPLEPGLSFALQRFFF